MQIGQVPNSFQDFMENKSRSVENLGKRSGDENPSGTFYWQ